MAWTNMPKIWHFSLLRKGQTGWQWGKQRGSNAHYVRSVRATKHMQYTIHMVPQSQCYLSGGFEGRTFRKGLILTTRFSTISTVHCQCTKLLSNIWLLLRCVNTFENIMENSYACMMPQHFFSNKLLFIYCSYVQ